MYQSLYRILIELTNGRYSSGLLKHFSQSRWSRPLILLYVKTFNLNQQEFGKDLKGYTNLHELFTRQLKADARPITAAPSAVASPVDGVLEDSGEISADKRSSLRERCIQWRRCSGMSFFGKVLRRQISRVILKPESLPQDPCTNQGLRGQTLDSWKEIVPR